MRKIGFKELYLGGKNLLKQKLIKLSLTPQESDVIYMRKKVNLFHSPSRFQSWVKEGLKQKTTTKN